MVLFISIEKVFLTFESEDEYLPLVLFIFLKKMALTFDSAEVLWDDYLMKEFNDSKDQILWCYGLRMEAAGQNFSVVLFFTR